MKNESRLEEIMGELLMEFQGYKIDFKEHKRDMLSFKEDMYSFKAEMYDFKEEFIDFKQKSSLQFKELRLSVIHLADKIEKIAQHEKRIRRLERAVLKK